MLCLIEKPLKMYFFYLSPPAPKQPDTSVPTVFILWVETEFFCNYLLCKLRLWLCVMMSPMTERDTIVFSPHKKKRAELVQTLPANVWLENVKGSVSSHRFYATSFHFFCSWDKRIKLFNSVTCSVLLKTAADQLCLKLVCCGFEKPFHSKDTC